MSYIGRSPQIGAYSKLDAITTDGSASYTMQLNSGNFVPESVNHLIVSVNGVIQAPTDSFTVSGSTITFASSLSVSDTIDFIMALGNVLDIGVPSDSTVSSSKIIDGAVSLAKLSATGTKDATTFLRGDNTFAVPSGGENTPAFHVNKTSSQDIPDNTWVKITFDTELLDTDNCVDSNRFTPTTAGKYFIYATLTVGSVSTVTNLRSSYTAIYKNGSLYTFSDNNWNGSFIFSATHHVGAIIDFNGSTDYVEVYGNGDLTTGNPRIHSSSNVQCYFGGYKIIGA